MYFPLEQYILAQLKMITLSEKERVYLDDFSNHLNITYYVKKETPIAGYFYNETLIKIPHKALPELIKELIKVYNKNKKKALENDKEPVIYCSD